MKNFMMTFAAVLCFAISVTVGLTSCSQSDNPIEPQPYNMAKMADVVKLLTVPQSIYKLDTDNEILPYYVIVDGLYKDKDGNELMYDFSQIIEAKIDGQSKYANSFTVDISQLAQHGFIKLIPNPDDDAFFLDLQADAHLDGFAQVFFDMELRNKSGETLKQNIRVKYVDIPAVGLSYIISVDDIEEDGTFLVDLDIPELPEFELNNTPFQRLKDEKHSETYDILSAELTDDYDLRLLTTGMPSDPDRFSTCVYTFKRKLVGIPYPVLDEELILVNFSIGVSMLINPSYNAD